MTSLDFVRKQYTAEQIFQHYQEEMDLNAEMLVNAADRCQLAKRYKVYSSEYRALNPCSFYRGVVPFHYLDPFVQSLAPHFIQVLQDCDWNQQDSVGSSCGLVWASRKFLKRIEAKQISTTTGPPTTEQDSSTIMRAFSITKHWQNYSLNI